MRNTFKKSLGVLASLFVATALVAQVVQIQPLYTFPVAAAGTTNGIGPSGALLLGADGWLYGTTKTGGLYNDPNGVGCGILFRVSPTNGTFQSLASFNYTNGARPNGELVQATNGVLYGVTKSGGPYGDGALYSSTTVGVLSLLNSFYYAPGLGFTAGAWPSSGVILNTNGALYGVTPTGGRYNSGTIYSSSLSGNKITLYDFNWPANTVPDENGAGPSAHLTQTSDGNLYGVAPFGGSNNQGFVYEYTVGGIYSNVYSFVGSNIGFNPSGYLTQGADGYLYGVLTAGSTNGYGAVYRILTNSYALSYLTPFDNTNGAYPIGGLVQGLDTYFYGANAFSNYGSLYQYATNGHGAITNLGLFAVTNGSGPSSSLVYDTNTSMFYGETLIGGLGSGVIYEMQPYPVGTSVSALSGTNSVTYSNITGSAGTTVVLSVQDLGLPPLAYQWYSGASTKLSATTNYSGVTTASLTIATVVAANETNYHCVVTNIFGTNAGTNTSAVFIIVN